MFFLIRHSTTQEVLGILNEREVLSDCDYLRIATARASVNYATAKDEARKLVDIINGNVYCLIAEIFSQEEISDIWYFQIISQAEFETYRDLHEFKVFTKL